MKNSISIDYLSAVLQALFVTVLWSSSWVIIKFGLNELPPLLFAGFRYLIGSILLLSVVLFSPSHREELKSNPVKWWGLLAIYGLVFITFTQGGQFLALSLLPAITVSFLLNLTTYVVIILSIFFLKEFPTRFDLFFFLLALVGILMYFSTFEIEINTLNGLIIGFLLVIVNAFSSILGRSINHRQVATPLVVTTVSMFFGSLALLFFGLMFERTPLISPTSIVLIIWLGVVNTALAFTIWNKAMQKIRAMDISIINSTMLPQIVILSVLFLEEYPTVDQWYGLIILIIATIFLQLNQARNDENSSGEV